jgi:23S rRNA A1618 N6-methylase RlmF
LALLLLDAGQLLDTVRLHTLDVGVGAACLSVDEL